MKSKDLILECCIASIHYDFSYTHKVVFGFDTMHRLIVMQEYGFDDKPELNHCVVATVSADEAFRMARRLKIGMTELPEWISAHYDFCESFYDEEIEEIFQDVLNLLLENNVHYCIDMQES
jgi:hypothetical protein